MIKVDSYGILTCLINIRNENFKKLVSEKLKFKKFTISKKQKQDNVD